MGKLDDQAESKLADILSRYDAEKRKEYMAQIEQHLVVSNRPSAMAMMLLKKLGNAEPLGPPGPIAPGSLADQARREGGKKEQDRERDRDRGRRDDRDRRDKSQRRSRDRDRERRS